MKAIVYRNYGGPDVLHYEDVEKGSPGPGEVLIKVRAASLNPRDWHFMRGSPYFVRLLSGAGKPKDIRFGTDMAGEVEAVGASVTQFHAGDAVFGGCRGAFAEYACASPSLLAMKPENLSFEQAAAVPTAALTALQALRDAGKIQPGNRVLINGAAGGVGTFAVQMAKSFGAEVTGVCSTRNVEMVRSIGADRVIDYSREDFTAAGQHYDLFLDAIGNHSLRACRAVLQPEGQYIVVGGTGGPWIGPLSRAIQAALLSRLVSQDLRMFLTKGNGNDLEEIARLLQSGRVRSVIDRRYKLEEVPQAIRYLEEGHARGKVLVTLVG